jgi:hypothetical protein
MFQKMFVFGQDGESDDEADEDEVDTGPSLKLAQVC